MKKTFIYIFLSLMVFLVSCWRQETNVVNDNLNNSNNNQQISENIKYSQMSISDRMNANCNNFQDSFEKAFCIENKKELKQQELFMNPDKSSSEKLLECSKLNKEIAYSWALSDATKCRIKIVSMSWKKLPWSKIQDTKIDCTALKQYNDEEICNNTMKALKRYSQIKNDERIYNEIFWIQK